MFDVSQYGVNTSVPSGLSAAGDAASMIPYIGPFLGAAFNMASMGIQNSEQERMYNMYMSPQARMAQMKAAGINPAAAAQGVSGSSAPQMNAAAPSSAFTGLGEQLGNSVNTALTADAIRAGINKTNAETELTNSLNVEKTTTNKYLDAMQNAALRNLVNQGTISEHQANIIAVDDYYKGAEAELHFQQSYVALQQMSAQLQNTQQEYFNLLAQEYATMMQGQLSEAQIQKVFSDIGLNNAQIEKIAHETVNIDAATMATMQNISESQSRERLNRAHAQYQEKVNEVWNNSGWNMNSDVNSNFYSMCMQGDYKGAEKLMQGTQALIMNEGNARFKSKDYKFDHLVGVIGMATKLAGAR